MKIIERQTESTYLLSTINASILTASIIANSSEATHPHHHINHHIGSGANSYTKWIVMFVAASLVLTLIGFLCQQRPEPKVKVQRPIPHKSYKKRTKKTNKKSQQNSQSQQRATKEAKESSQRGVAIYEFPPTKSMSYSPALAINKDAFSKLSKSNSNRQNINISKSSVNNDDDHNNTSNNNNNDDDDDDRRVRTMTKKTIRKRTNKTIQKSNSSVWPSDNFGDRYRSGKRLLSSAKRKDSNKFSFAASSLKKSSKSCGGKGKLKSDKSNIDSIRRIDAVKYKPKIKRTTLVSLKSP